MGEFNIDLLKVGTNTRLLDFYALMTSFGYSAQTLRPTRVTTHCRFLTDQIWTNAVDSIDTSGVILPDISDYFPIFSRIK